MNRAALVLALISLVGISCERHSWEETKGLHSHGKKESLGETHGDAHAAPHGDAAKPADAHGTDAAKPAAAQPSH